MANCRSSFLQAAADFLPVYPYSSFRSVTGVGNISTDCAPNDRANHGGRDSPVAPADLISKRTTGNCANRLADQSVRAIA
jgi:hypothetical protein